MPFFEHGTARLFYEDEGEGPAIVTTHGAAENHLYWKLPGIVERLLAAGYRVISTDMRGHGRSRADGPMKGYDVDTVAGDFSALADHLGLESFHLLTHATGGNAGLRYAMSNPPRLLSLMSTGSSAATWPTDQAAEVTDPSVKFARVGTGQNPMAQAFRGKPWAHILRLARANAERDAFMCRMPFAVDPDQAFAWYEACLRRGDPDVLWEFMHEFFTDADPYIARLREIRCPCLVLIGDHDWAYYKPSLQLAREIPDARLVVLEGRGHMTAFEDPRRTGDEILAFLAGLSQPAARPALASA
jgi:pimeloyl-ACP methyl ester carboxylesterase